MAGAVTITVLQNNSPVKLGYNLLSMTVVREMNRIPYAELIYQDGHPEKQQFELTDGGIFKAGTEIEIKARYEGKRTEETSLFKGVAVRQNLRLHGTSFVLEVELSDPAIKLTAGRKSQIYEKVKDSDVIGKIIQTAGIKKGSIENTSVTHPRLIQYHATDWDFILSRAEANGLLVQLTDGKLIAKKPVLAGSAKKYFKLGVDQIYHFEFETDARNQRTAVQSSSYDLKTKKLSKPVSGKAFQLNQKQLNASSINKPMGNANEVFVSGAALNPGEAQALANALVIKNRMSAFKGTLRIDGSGKFVPGDLVSLKGMSKLFEGNVMVTGVRHEVNSSGWFTDLQFGLAAERFPEQYAVNEVGAMGLVPGVNGLQIGIVDKFLADPDKEFRFQVIVPTINTPNNKVWARLAVPDGGQKHGFCFYPEPGDEVILGFFNDDPRQAVILGSMYGSGAPPGIKPADKNMQKGYTSKTGFKIMIDEEKKTMSIETPGKQQVLINDEKKSIDVKDKTGNQITLNDKGMKLTCKKDFQLLSSGEIKIKSSKAVKIEGPKVEVN